MGRVVDLNRLELEADNTGVARAPVTAGDTREFAAEFVRIPAGKTWQATAPAGSDVYVFTLKGRGTIVAANYRRELPTQAFATIGEGVGFAVQASTGETLELIRITTPLQGGSRTLPGFTAALAVAERAREPVVPIPDQHKQRIYFAGHQHGARTERGHAMIVVYDGETVTGLHHHPNAESMFVMLDGACRFTVNGKPAVVGPGQVAYFVTNDTHGLATASGHAGASFLEFHIPAAFTTVKA